MRLFAGLMGLAIAAAPAQAQNLRALDTADAARSWEAVGRLDTGVSFCSATLIAPDRVLTAAHCLFDERGTRLADGDLTFSASLRHGRAEAYRGIRASHIPGDYPGPRAAARAQSIGFDVAVLELDRAIPAQTVAPLQVGAAGDVRDLVTVVSYGRDREAVASIEEGCEILAEEGRVHILSCSVVSGSSGAPILRVEEGHAEVIAVVSAVAEWNGGPVSVAVAGQDLIADMMARAGSVPVVDNPMPQGVRRLTVGDGDRSGLGARFVRP